MSNILKDVDLTPPTVTWKQVDHKETGKERIEITIKDNDSGVKYYKLTYSSDEKNGTYKEMTPAKSKTVTWVVDANKTVYLYAKDANGNLVTKKIASSQIDISNPSFVQYKVVKQGSSKYIEFIVKDNGTGDSGLKAYGLSTDSTGADVTYYNYSSAEAKKETTKKITVKTKGLYFLFIKDNVGHIAKIGPIWDLLND